jgi:hypothetical protein
MHMHCMPGFKPRRVSISIQYLRILRAIALLEDIRTTKYDAIPEGSQ